MSKHGFRLEEYLSVPPIARITPFIATYYG